MKATEHDVQAYYDDKVVFPERGKARKERDVVKVWRQSRGPWKDHPVFQGMAVKEVIEWLRGEDSDVEGEFCKNTLPSCSKRLLRKQYS